MEEREQTASTSYHRGSLSGYTIMKFKDQALSNKFASFFEKQLLKKDLKTSPHRSINKLTLTVYVVKRAIYFKAPNKLINTDNII